MLKHYIKFAIRNFRSHKIIFGGSLLTLCLGALCISLLFSYAYNELTMNDSLKNKDNIYLTTLKRTPQSIPAAFDIQGFFEFDYTKYPEIKSFSDVQRLPEDYIKFIYKQNTYAVNGLGADSTFFEVFDFPLIRGNRKEALNVIDKIVLTQKMAKKLFGDKDPIGKVITVQAAQKVDYTVSGILKNPPANSSLQFDFVMASYGRGYGRVGGNFLLAGPSFDKNKFEAKIKHLGDSRDDYKNSELSLIPFAEIYNNKGAFKDYSIFSRYGDQKSLNTLLIIMLVILLISVLNFSNLQIINTNTRVKTSAIKRVIGAESRHLSRLNIFEIGLLVLIAAFIVSELYLILLPRFNNLTQVYLDPPLSFVWLLIIGVLCSIALIGMIYPLLISVKMPIIKGLHNQGVLASQLKGRKAVIVVQYTLTFILLISSIMVVKQLQMMLNKNMGFETESIITTKFIGTTSWEARDQALNKYESMKNSLAANPNIASFTQGRSPIEVYPMDWKITEGNHKYDSQNNLFVNLDYDQVLGLEMLEGRFFQRGKDSSRAQQVVINEAAKKYWNITDIHQNTLWNKSWSEGYFDKGAYEIIGVVKDFNYEHLSAKPQPLIILFFENIEDRFIIKFEKGAEKAGLAAVQTLFKEQNPNEVFSYTFLKDEVAALYHNEKQLSINYVLFTLIALLISAIGLFTIALYDTQRRTKEIAIRKVNGAKISEILSLLNKSFIKWILLAFTIACPIAYFAMSKWLENFAYKTNLSWWVFALAGLFTIIIALLTVSWQSYKAASANPVKSLRTE